MDLTCQFKETARRLGFDRVGVAPVSRFELAPAGRRPTDVDPGAKSVVVFITRMLNTPIEFLPERRITYNIHWEEHRHRRMTATYEMAHFIEDHGFRAHCGVTATSLPRFHHRADFMHIFPETATPESPNMDDPGSLRRLEAAGTLSTRRAAVEAGLGEVGINNLLITPDFGPRICINSIITDAELEPDARFVGELCDREGCLVCLEACPAGAMGEDGSFDRSKCASYQEKTLGGLRCGLCLKACAWRKDYTVKRREL